jgi:hypothetical protein
VSSGRVQRASNWCVVYPLTIGFDMSNRLFRAAALAATPVAALALTAALSMPASAQSASGAVQAAARLTCSAAMTNSHPADYTSTGIKISTAAFAHIETVAHYKTVTHPKYGTASGSGKQTIKYYISGATPGYRVVVDIYVSRNGKKGSCSTSFTPHR